MFIMVVVKSKPITFVQLRIKNAMKQSTIHGDCLSQARENRRVLTPGRRAMLLAVFHSTKLQHISTPDTTP